MKIKLHKTPATRAIQGFGMIDALMGMAISGIMFVALYAGLAFGFNVVKFARENTRATQIMLEKMETIRLYTWTQINTPNFIPTNKFTVPYYAVGNGTNASLLYTGQVFITSSALGTSYADDMKKVTVRLNWVTGTTPRSREMSTYVARNGLQSYVY